MPHEYVGGMRSECLIGFVFVIVGVDHNANIILMGIFAIPDA